jgi:hypothetical protein
MSRATNHSALLINHSLGLEGMSFLLATLKLLLSVLGSLNWSFGDIDHNKSRHLMPLQQPFLPRQTKVARTNQGVFDVVDDPADRCF